MGRFLGERERGGQTLPGRLLGAKSRYRLPISRDEKYSSYHSKCLKSVYRGLKMDAKLECVVVFHSALTPKLGVW